MNSTLLKILIWTFVSAFIMVVGYWNVLYGQIVIGNQNFPQIVGFCVITIVELILTFYLLKFTHESVKNL